MWAGVSHGAQARGLFELHKGEKLYMMIGQQGMNACKKVCKDYKFKSFLTLLHAVSPAEKSERRERQTPKSFFNFYCILLEMSFNLIFPKQTICLTV